MILSGRRLRSAAAVAALLLGLALAAGPGCGDDDLRFPGAGTARTPTSGPDATPTPERSATACQPCDIEGCCAANLGVEACTGQGDPVSCADGSEDQSCVC